MKSTNISLFTLFVCAALLLAACTPVTQSAPPDDSRGPPASSISEEPESPGSNAVPTQDETAASPSSSMSNIPAQTGDYRSGKTLQIPITITASGFAPPILTVGYGDRVKLTISNEDTKTHTFEIKEYSLTKTLAPDDTVTVDFYAIIKGEFKYDDTYTCLLYTSPSPRD
jgi:plastocyanin